MGGAVGRSQCCALCSSRGPRLARPSRASPGRIVRDGEGGCRMDAAPSGEPSCVSSHESCGAAAGLRPWHLSQLPPPSPKGHERAPQAGKRGVGRHNATRAGARREEWMGFVQSCMSCSASGQELSGELARPTARCGEAGRERRGSGEGWGGRAHRKSASRADSERAKGEPLEKMPITGKRTRRARRHKILRGGGDRKTQTRYEYIYWLHHFYQYYIHNIYIYNLLGGRGGGSTLSETCVCV